MMKTRKFNIVVAIILALTMVMPTSMTVYAADNEAYVYQYEDSVGYANNKVYYADGSGSASAYLIYTSGPEGKQQYGGYCADFETSLDYDAYYSRTTLGESGHFSDSVTGHLRAILANSVPVKNYLDVAAAAGVTEISQGEVVSATQWAIWAYTNSSSPEIAVPSKDGTTAQEKVAYYLYNLPPITSGYATEPVLMSIAASQDGSKMIFDYSGSVNIDAMYNKVITVTDADGNALPYTDENYRVIVDVSGLNSDQTVNINIEGQQTLAADAYFYNPEGGRGTSQSLISWFEGVTSVAGSGSGTYEVEKENTQLVLTGDKKLTGREIDTAVDDFEFVVKAADTGDVAATGTVDADGKITFTPIEYTKVQAGQVYNYNVTEVAGTNPGMEYDTAVKTVAVKVSYEDGQVKTDVTYGEEGGIVFENKYTAEDAVLQLDVKKKLDGKELQEGQFRFTKVKCDADGVPLDGAETETVTNREDGTVQFAAETYTVEGVHYYLIEEVDGGKRIDGITYDNLEIVVKVTVKDNKLGQLVAAAEYPADAVFDNRYTADPVEVVLEGHKVLEGRPLADGEFTFVLKDKSDKEAGKSVNSKDGKIEFGPLVFNEAGEYVYRIEEVNTGADGVTYDSAVHEVTVKVTDNGKGKLVAEIIYPESGVVFHNTYKGQGQIKVTKIFKLNDAEKAADLKFEIGIYTDEGLKSKAVRADGTEVENKVIDMNQHSTAAVIFDGLEYGTYYVAEIGIDGMPLAAGEVTGMLGHAAFRQTVTYGQGSVVLTIDNKTGSAEITNDFYTEEYLLQGEIKVTKKVLTDGEANGVDAKFFTALFADPELSQLASEVKIIEMGGQAEASVIFENLEINKTYYVAETDMQGSPLKAGDYNISNITVENGAVELAAGMAEIPEVMIINEYDTDEFDYFDDDEEGTDGEEESYEEETEVSVDEEKEKVADEAKARVVEKDKVADKDDEAEDVVQTGDEFNSAIAVFAMAAALMAMIGAVILRRREVEEE